MALEDIKGACGLIQGGGLRGTGYLVAADLLATCAHVVKDVPTSQLSVMFIKCATRKASVTRGVTHIHVCEELDCAVLTLDVPITDAKALVLCAGCDWNADWHSFGFPEQAVQAGITFRGLITDPAAHDDKDAEVLELTCDEVGAGQATPIGGLSGGPVVVDDQVVGHLKRIVGDSEDESRPAYGKVYATRAQCVIDLVGSRAPVPPTPAMGAPAPGSPAALSHAKAVKDLHSSWLANGNLPPEFASKVAADSLIDLGDRANAGKVLLAGFEKSWTDEIDGTLFARNIDTYINPTKHLTLTNPSYALVNSAAMANWGKQPQTSVELAKRALDEMERIRIDSTNSMELAMKGEAYLLLGELNTAQDWCRKALQEAEPAAARILKEQWRMDQLSMGYDLSSLKWLDKL